MEKSEFTKEELKEVLEQLTLRIRSCITTVKALREWTDEEIDKRLKSSVNRSHFSKDDYDKEDIEYWLSTVEWSLEDATNDITMILKYNLD